MNRVRVIAQQVTVVGDGPDATFGGSSPRREVKQASRGRETEALVRKIQSSSDPREQRKLLLDEIVRSGDKLKADGTWPLLTLFETGLATGHDADVSPKVEIQKVLEANSGGFVAAGLLPGPWNTAKTVDEQVAMLQHVSKNEAMGYSMFQYMKWMQEFGDAGLASNIAVPFMSMHGSGSKMRRVAGCRVLLGNPADAERISRTHTRKEGNFCPVLYDSVIATEDNEHWQAQRRHLAEAFLPLSSLAEILPKSLERARSCSQRLAGLARGGSAVDMSDFLLHEAQAQLQLALLGCEESFMEETNHGIRATFMGEPDKADVKVGTLTAAMQDIMERCGHPSFALPSEKRPIVGPLSRAVGTGDLPGSANFGNMLLILFAGHDTTGHTMTWLLFELARHPQVQKKLQQEVDSFWAQQNGREPTYRDLSRLPFMDRCITETLRLWPAVANGTFRQLQFADSVTGPGGKEVMLPRGTAVQIPNWPRHRNLDLWGADAASFNPEREFQKGEMASVGCPMAAANIQSERFSPFAHAPRSCLGRNFAQMEMRLIMLYLLKEFDFSLAPPFDRLAANPESSPSPDALEFRGVNRGTMGPMDLEGAKDYAWGTRHTVAMKMFAKPRA